ncbi:hypothetical protein K440DRAFT_425416 [Wilcoxina mikolae CBS 423.85]|nr:hypothetical protein K440DRAFT_425416 [Wilcoxina mikolae CBS 423.85]
MPPSTWTNRRASATFHQKQPRFPSAHPPHIMNVPNALDIYVRSAAASVALAPNCQFIGRKQLPSLCAPLFPEEITLGFVKYTKARLLSRLDELLLVGHGGLASELDERAKAGTLGAITLPFESHQQRLRIAEATVKAERLQRQLAEATATAGKVSETVVAELTAEQNQSVPSVKSSVSSPPEKPPSSSSEKLPVSSPSSTPPPQITPTTTPLPYALQHAVLPPLQSFLEEACHRYISKVLPQLLRQKGWTFPQSAEFQVYTRDILVAQPQRFTDPTALKNLNEIRHVAVHRVPLVEAKLNELLEAAAEGARVLEDVQTQVKILELQVFVKKWLEKRRDSEDDRETARKRIEFLESEIKKMEAEIRKLDTHILKLDKVNGKVMKDLKSEVEGLLCVTEEEVGGDKEEEKTDAVSGSRPLFGGGFFGRFKAATVASGDV